MPESRYPLSSQPWLEELLLGSAEGIALFDPGDRIVQHNVLLRQFLSPNHQAIDGAELGDLFADPTWPLAMAAARHRGYWQGQLWADERPLDARLRIGRDGRGVLLCRDLSQQAELDRRARTLAAQLEAHLSEADQARELLFEQTERLTTVYQLTLDALESATVRDTAHRICRSLVDDLEAENAAIWLLDQDQEFIRRIAAEGRRAKALPISCHRDQAPNLDEALRSGVPVPVGDGGALTGFAVFVLPGRGQPLGVITLDHAPDLDKVSVYAPHVATAINNAIMAEELARANLQLRAIDQQKSEFLNIVAHDLRTPLTCIRTYTDLITMYVDEDPATYAEFLQVIAEETERLGELLDNFLDLARIENATMRYELEPLRVDEIAQHSAQVYRAKANAERIELEVEIEPDVPVIEADRRRLEQVLSNLLSNAFKFTPAGGRVVLGVAPDPEGDGAKVTIDDTGPGVAKDQRQRIFERFRQAQAGHARGGSGLGLAIAQAIVAHHGGCIWVDDAPGGGARFVFSLPARPPDDSAAGRSRS